MRLPRGNEIRRRLGSLEPLKIWVLPALVLAAALLFALPWLPEPSPGGAALERYSPTRDGGSVLVEEYDADGGLVFTESQNMVVIPTLRAFSGLRQDLQEGLEKLYGSPEGAGDVRIIEVRRRAVSASGEISETTDTLVLDSRGLLLLGNREGAEGTDAVFDPPALLLPADLGPGSRWSSEGKFGSLDYDLSGRVLGSGAFESELGSFDDCLKVEVRIVYSQAGQPGDLTTFKDRYCAGVGLVESRRFDGSGEMVRRSVVVSTDRVSGDREARLHPVSLVPENGPSADPANWQLAHFGHSRLSDEGTVSSVAPTYLPTDPPVVLAAAQEGDLVALDAGEIPGTVRWRFHPDGTIYGQPTSDAKTGHVYFGATDKKLYALDARGLFLWAFETGDNVASRPVIAGDTVVFGSEDRHVYGLDAMTGQERWSVETGGPVVSSPAFAEGVAVIGSDDGAVYGLDPKTGEERWLYLAEGPVEAPVVAADGVAYAASRSGELAALDARTGREVWVSAPGEVLRTAPAVGETEVFVVDDGGGLLAFDRRTGKKRWEVPDGTYVGPPLLLGGELLVASNDGYVYRFGPDGERRGRWEGASAGNPLDGDPNFSVGPTAGGGAAWVAADTAAVLRIGPAVGPAHIEPVWAIPFSRPPFSGDYMWYTPADYRGEALLVGTNNNIYLSKVAGGEARKVGQLDAGSEQPISEPVVAGDTLLASFENALHAAGLPDGETLWRAEGKTNLRPPVVAGETVLWHSTPENADSSTLRALNLRTGRMIWEAPLADAAGVVVRGETAYANPASAFDLKTGEALWRAESLGGSPSGGPALSESGDALFAGMVSADERSGSVVALDAKSGDELWRVELEGESVGFADRLWVSGDVLVVPLLSGGVTALDAKSGEELWRYEPSFPRLGNVTVEGGRVWFALQNGEILALDAESGEVVARSNDYSLNLNNPSIVQRPAFIGGKLVLGVGTYVLGFEPPEEVRDR